MTYLEVNQINGTYICVNMAKVGLLDGSNDAGRYCTKNVMVAIPGLCLLIVELLHAVGTQVVFFF